MNLGSYFRLWLCIDNFLKEFQAVPKLTPLKWGVFFETKVRKLSGEERYLKRRNSLLICLQASRFGWRVERRIGGFVGGVVFVGGGVEWDASRSGSRVVRGLGLLWCWGLGGVAEVYVLKKVLARGLALITALLRESIVG